VDDGNAPPRQPVEEAAFADIWPANDDDGAHGFSIFDWALPRQSDFGMRNVLGRSTYVDLNRFMSKQAAVLAEM
jgi:hypothetical protein